MELCTRFCVLFFGLILLLSCFLLFECRKLDGYKFPVYSTKHCPRNKTEWNQRSTAINCTEDNGYVCLPNENITELLEFCYTYPFILIQEGICLYLRKEYSVVDSYSCIHFLSGCPNSSFVSYNQFKNPQCTSIGNGCFLAEPSCQISYPSYATEKNRLGSSKDWVLIGTTCVVFIITCFTVVCVIKSRTDIINVKRIKDVEKPGEEELLPFISQNQQDKIESCVEESPLDKVLIEQWQEDNKQFVETKASREVERLINIQNIVIVAGHSGSGKSAIVHHIALKYRSQGWIVKLVYTVKNMIEIIDSSTTDLNDSTLFVLNDPIGKDSFDEINYTLWRKYEENIKACLNKIKLLMSCRKYILSDDKVKGLLKDKSNIVDITNDQFKLSVEEKEKFLKMYAFDENESEEDTMEILKTEAYFPLLCKLYFSKKSIINDKLRFFKAPIEVFEEEIRDFRKSSKDKYCALVLLVLFNNPLCVEDVRKDAISREKYKLALELCEINKDTAPHSIGDAFESLQGFFVKKNGNAYQFYHDIVMEVTTYVFGRDYPPQIIKYADIGFLRKRVKLICCNDNNDQFTIYLNNTHIDALGKRLFNDIFGERLLDVVLNPCLKNKGVIDTFINELKRYPEKLKMLLDKKKLQVDCEDFKQTSNYWFFSKISFVSLQKRLSPLNAIIIFCDKRLSLYCLEALKRKPQFFKESSLFSSLCCNGSKDVFDMFMKDHLRECLTEKWNFLYPIHIASVFNNYEILQELLQVGADVDLKTTNYNYWTPLTLAAGHQTEENNDNESKTSSQNRRNETVELLLSKGANINLCKENGASPLYIACQEGHDEIVEILLSKGADINKCTKNGASPLTIACKEGHESIVQTLVSKRVNINSSMEDGSNPLFKACQEGHENIVKILLQKEANVNFRIKDGSTPLLTACQKGHTTIVQLLLNNKANINLCKKNGASPLYTACEKGYEIIVKHLLEKGADYNICKKNGDFPLHIACQNGDTMTVLHLLNAGADVDICGKDGVTPLYIACQEGHDEIVNLLLDKAKGIRFSTKNRASPLFVACRKGHINIVQKLLKAGAKVNVCAADGTSPLFVACQYGHERIVQLLLSNRADINLCLKNGASPLFIACKHGYENLVKLLLSNGAYINLCMKNGISPLYIACQRGHDNIVQVLLSYGADINLCDDIIGVSPLDIACQNGHEHSVHLLLSHGADTNLCRKNGASPLVTTCLHGHDNIVQLLLRNGADINLCNEFGASPLHIACEKGHVNIALLLLNSGADINLCDDYGASPLYRACEHGYDSIVQILLSKDADINLCLKTGESPLHIACKNNLASIVNLLASNGADINLAT